MIDKHSSCVICGEQSVQGIPVHARNNCKDEVCLKAIENAIHFKLMCIVYTSNHFNSKQVSPSSAVNVNPLRNKQQIKHKKSENQTVFMKKLWTSPKPIFKIDDWNDDIDFKIDKNKMISRFTSFNCMDTISWFILSRQILANQSHSDLTITMWIHI